MFLWNMFISNDNLMPIYIYSSSFFFTRVHCLSQVIQREPWEHIKDVEIKKTAASFCGEIWQVPPMFSAIKVSIISKITNESSW